MKFGQPMACGGCGCGTFRMFQEFSDYTNLLAECTECKSVSVIKPSRQTLEIKWGDDNQKGVLCQMEPKS